MKASILICNGLAAASLWVAMGGSASADGAPDCGLNTGKPATGEPIPIGGIVSKTGPDDFSASGRAAAAYFKCVNANGGIHGRPVEYTMEDDAWTPETSAQAAAKLVNDKKVLAMVGDMSFVDCAANEALYEKENVLVVAGVGVPRECFHSKNYAPTNMGPRLSNIGAIADLYEDHKIKSVVCIALNVGNLAKWTCDGTAEWGKSRGVEVHSILMDPASVDATSIILQAMSFKPDVIDLNMPKPLAVPLFAAAEEQNLRDKVYFTGPASLYNADFPKAIGPYWNGKVTVDMEFNDLNLKQPDTENWHAIMDKFGESSDPRDTFSQAGYLAARIVTNSLLSLDPQNINRDAETQALRTVHGFKSDILCAPWYFGPGAEHNPNHSGPVAIVKDGGFVTKRGCLDIEDPELSDIRKMEKDLKLTE